MKKQVLLIHGGGEGAYAADQEIANALQKALGTAYEVHYPPMPDEDSPDYNAWKDEFAAKQKPSMILVGHSLGASFLLKYLAEERVEMPVAGLFLLATPYWGASDWEVDEYALSAGFAEQLPPAPIYLYHSRDDDIVPVDHLAIYAKQLPQAHVRKLNGRGHQFSQGISEVVADITSL